jgi:hypothetical protein
MSIRMLLVSVFLLIAVSCTPSGRAAIEPCADPTYLKLKSQTSFTHEDSLRFAALDRACIDYTTDRSETSGRSGNTVLLVIYGILGLGATIALLTLFRSLGSN